ncbi:hypothetical protein KJ633_03015 [bacterium]|nr:hypothetical protein [bacterium]MBU3955406.1 hypothetical protein [bacterium]MBU4134151.1 hypothetical protein [bacterium]
MREARVAVGVKIKKLKIKPSPGKVFYRVYEKGHPETIPELKKAARKAAGDYDSYSALIYKDTGKSFVFMAGIYASNTESASAPPEDKIKKAVFAEVFLKMKKIMSEIAARELGEKKLEVESEDISPAEAAKILGADGFDFEEGPIAGEFKI